MWYKNERMKNVYIIKPEGSMCSPAVTYRIRNAGMRITLRISCVLPDWFIKELYPGTLPNGLWPELCRHMQSEVAEISIVEGGDSVAEDLVQLCGTEINPAKCRPGSIRYDFFRHYGMGIPYGTAGGLYYPNGIHRPKPDEVEKDLNLVRRLVSSLLV